MMSLEKPPFSSAARVETGYLLRLVQRGINLSLPFSRPMPSIGVRCHELRITDRNRIWRVIYRTDTDAVVIAEVFEKKTRKTPKSAIDRSRLRLRMYDNESS